jgi:Rps23 Pro-64 3,4-dihydroxylase Tpa1-like proline 4-hydroxylase
MKNKKSSFLFYFDNYPILLSLPPEQRGWLITALCSYADQVWRDGTVTAEDVMDQYAMLSKESCIAFQFMAATILRDTQQWMRKRELRTQNRQQQSKVESPEETARRTQQDMDQLRRILGK